MNFLYENTRVIASAPAKTATADGVYVITFTTIGGDDAGGTGVDTEPCMLSATLKYNNELLASISGVDNPFDWTNGPEISVGKDYIPQFNPTVDWNRGTWSYSGGDWEHYTSWKMSNSNIRLPGWNAISMQHKAKIGGKKHGIRITSYSVKEVNPINPATSVSNGRCRSCLRRNAEKMEKKRHGGILGCYMFASTTLLCPP